MVRASSARCVTRDVPAAPTCSWSAPAARPGRSCTPWAPPVARSPWRPGAVDAAESAAGLAPGAHGDRRSKTLVPGPFSLVVNATPIGMQGEAGPFAVDDAAWTSSCSTPCNPIETPLLAAARARARAANGLGMLVHQAASRSSSSPASRATRRDAGRRRQDRRRMSAALVVGVLGARPGGRVAPRTRDRVRPAQRRCSGRRPDEPPSPPRGGCGVTVADRRALRWPRRPLPRLVAAARLPRPRRGADGALGDRPRDVLLPNRIVYPLRRGASAARRGRRGDGESPSFGRACSRASAFAVFFVLHLASPPSMGLGDVKLSSRSGLALGWLGWGEVVLGRPRVRLRCGGGLVLVAAAARHGSGGPVRAVPRRRR